MTADDERARRAAARSARATLAALGAPRLAVEVLVVTPAESARLNGRFRRKPRPADVLSFPAPGAVPGGTVGSLVLAPAVIRRRARRLGLPYASWLRELAVHGTLHLLGFHHDDPEAARRLFALQRALVGARGR